MSLIEQFKTDRENVITDGIALLGMIVILIMSEMILHPIDYGMLEDKLGFETIIHLTIPMCAICVAGLLMSLCERYKKLSQGV